jgi:hypothetical protein
MAPPTKKQINKGFYGFETDDAEFLKVERDPWEASASGVGYNAKFDDDYGYRAGQGAYSDEGGDGALTNKLADERVDYAHEGLSPLIDDSQPYDKLLTGGAGLTKGKGVGAGKPRFAPKTGPRTNSRG